jgi:hypothetical protein
LYYFEANFVLNSKTPDFFGQTKRDQEIWLAWFKSLFFSKSESLSFLIGVHPLPEEIHIIFQIHQK